jgi:hypothetical protein
MPKGTPTMDSLDELLDQAEEILADPLNHRFEPLLLLKILTQLAYEYRTHKHESHAGTTGPPAHPSHRLSRQHEPQWATEKI